MPWKVRKIERRKVKFEESEGALPSHGTEIIITKNMMKKELFMYNSKYKTNEIKNQKSVQNMG